MECREPCIGSLKALIKGTDEAGFHEWKYARAVVAILKKM